MRTVSTRFISQIELPCTVTCGEDGKVKVSGTAVRIESARLVLRVRSAKQAILRLGDEIRLNVHLPAQEGIAAKDLSVRARIIEVSEMREGARTFVVSFRRAQFKDREQPAAAVKPQAMPAKWAM